jgi:hypothetical protein
MTLNQVNERVSFFEQYFPCYILLERIKINIFNVGKFCVALTKEAKS